MPPSPCSLRSRSNKKRRKGNEFLIEHAPSVPIPVVDPKVEEEARRKAEEESVREKEMMVKEAKERRWERKGKGIEIGIIEHVLA